MNDVMAVVETDHMYMHFAVSAALRPHESAELSDTTHVGCAIRQSRSRGGAKLLSVGWNGMLPGVTEQHSKTMAPKKKTKGQHKAVSMCAERCALFHAACDVRESTMYVTHSPCKNCALAMIHAGVFRVVYLYWMHGSESGVQLLALSDTSCMPLAQRSRFLQLYSRLALAKLARKATCSGPDCNNDQPGAVAFFDSRDCDGMDAESVRDDYQELYKGSATGACNGRLRVFSRASLEDLVPDGASETHAASKK